MECCCEQLRKDHYHNYPCFKTSDSEETILGQIRQVAVRAKNRAVNRFKLHTLVQDKWEPVQRFSGRIKDLASVSEYSVHCSSCQSAVTSYMDEVIMGQIISGLADFDIQKDVLSNPEAKSFNLEKLLSYIEGKESGQTSQGLVSTSKVDLVSEKKPRKCRFCGEMHILGRKNCKASGKQCEKCGKKDHFAKVCKSGRKNDLESAKPDASAETVSVEDSFGANSNWVCSNFMEKAEYEPHLSSGKNEDVFYRINENTLNYSAPKASRKALGSHDQQNNKSLNYSASKTSRNVLGSHDNQNFENCVAMASLLLTGSAIMSTFPSDRGAISSSQSVEASEGSIILGHHVYDKGKGWLRKAARVRPLVNIYSKLDMSAYKALGVKPPAKQCKVSNGQHLADTGASICLGSKSYLKSLGLSLDDL